MGLTIFFGTVIMPPESPEITALLKAWGGGDAAALDQLTPLVYEELRRLARRYMRNEHARNTLQTTALVNEAYLRLVDAKRVSWQDRVHFFAVSAQMMRKNSRGCRPGTRLSQARRPGEARQSFERFQPG